MHLVCYGCVAINQTEAAFLAEIDVFCSAYLEAVTRLTLIYMHKLAVEKGTIMISVISYQLKFPMCHHPF